MKDHDGQVDNRITDTGHGSPQKPVTQCCMWAIKLLVVSTIFLSAMAQAAFSITGAVSWMEVWRTGNVAFQLSTATSSCNGYFILNASDPGFKNVYAALLAAKRTGTQIAVFSTACVAADNYVGSSYNNVDYLYPQD